METRFLAPLLDRPGSWASVYLDTSRATQNAADQQRLRARAAAEGLTGQGADDDTRDAVTRPLAAEPASGSPPGRALFATGAEVVLDLPLATAPPSVLTSWSALPRITPLLDLLEDTPACLVARIDHTGADIELSDARGHHPVGRADGAEWRGRGHRSLPADRQEWHYRHRIENGWARTADIIARTLARHWASNAAQLLLLAGDPRERHAVLERLPEQIRSRTTETGQGGRHRGAAPEPLHDAITAARSAYRRHRLGKTLDLFRAGRGRPGEHRIPGAETPPGQAAEGVPAVVEAARSHQVATLLLAAAGSDIGHQVWIGPAPDEVAVRRTEARATGVRRPQSARADDALLRAAAGTDAEVMRVPDGAPGPSGGCGAVLREDYQRPVTGTRPTGQHQRGQRGGTPQCPSPP
jgi:hypothetical protein